MSIAPGARPGPYEVLTFIGAGGMGEVYKARDIRLNRVVALKVPSHHQEGETLASRLQRGPLPVDLALRAAIEIADALDRAHRHGIIHRELKPGNIMLTKGGVKLLDFGLARFRPQIGDVPETVPRSP